MHAELEDIVQRFTVLTVAEIQPLTGGHIHDSYVLTCTNGYQTRRFVLQRINSCVFPDVAGMMQKITRVTQHVRQRLVEHYRRDLGREPTAPEWMDLGRRVLHFVPERNDGRRFVQDPTGVCWRLSCLVEGASVHTRVESAHHAKQAGRAFGEFQRLLADLPPPRLHETIPDFHNTPLRVEALERAVRNDVAGRAANTKAELEFALDHRSLAPLLADLHAAGEIPERVVHNDAKISNVLFDAATDAAVCVIDLDTVMPGLSLHDFGDMVRSMTCTAAEDEQDLSKVRVELRLFEGLARGYLSEAGTFLNAVEREHLVTAGKVITYEQGVRFLTDYLEGDPYYRIERADQNLDRCRTQFELLKSINSHETRMRKVIDGACRGLD